MRSDTNYKEITILMGWSGKKQGGKNIIITGFISSVKSPSLGPSNTGTLCDFHTMGNTI